MSGSYRARVIQVLEWPSRWTESLVARALNFVAANSSRSLVEISGRDFGAGLLGFNLITIAPLSSVIISTSRLLEADGRTDRERQRQTRSQWKNAARKGKLKLAKVNVLCSSVSILAVVVVVLRQCGVCLGLDPMNPMARSTDRLI